MPGKIFRLSRRHLSARRVSRQKFFFGLLEKNRLQLVQYIYAKNGTNEYIVTVYRRIEFSTFIVRFIRPRPNRETSASSLIKNGLHRENPRDVTITLSARNIFTAQCSAAVTANSSGSGKTVGSFGARAVHFDAYHNAASIRATRVTVVRCVIPRDVCAHILCRNRVQRLNPSRAVLLSNLKRTRHNCTPTSNAIQPITNAYNTSNSACNEDNSTTLHKCECYSAAAAVHDFISNFFPIFTKTDRTEFD